MLFSILIFVATAIGATIDSSMPVDSLYEDFFTSDNFNLITPDDYSLLSSIPSDHTFDRPQDIGFDDIPYFSFDSPQGLGFDNGPYPSFDHPQDLSFDDVPYLTSEDQASSDLSDLLFGSDSPDSIFATSCNIEKRNKGACSVDSVPQNRLEFPDALQMGNTIVKENPLLAPITIEIEENSPGKCVDLLHPLNLCCRGPLGTLADGYYPLTVYETINRCRPGKWLNLRPKTQFPPYYPVYCSS